MVASARRQSRSRIRVNAARSSCPATITVKELAELLGVNPADVIRELIKSGIFATINQLIDRDTAALVAGELGYEVAEAVAVTAGVTDKDAERGPGTEAAKEVLFEEDEASLLQTAGPDRDRHGSRRPRQDEPARRDPDDRGRGRRAGRHHPAHRRQRGHDEGRPTHRLPRHPGPRGVHGDAGAWRTGHRHRGRRGGRGRRRHAPDARGDRPRPRGQGADHHRPQQDRQARREPGPGQDRAVRGGRHRRGVRRRHAARARVGARPGSGSTSCST